MSSLPIQTGTPYLLSSLPSKASLVNEFKGRSLSSLRTPAFVVDRAIFARNCARMHESAKSWDAEFRAHVKTHKTAEGTRLQLVSSSNKTSAVIVSTLMEAWNLVLAGSVADNIVNDILYGLPVSPNKIADLAALSDALEAHNGTVRLIVDHPDQIQALESYNSQNNRRTPWSVFVKVDSGNRRAGLSPNSQEFKALLLAILAAPAVSIHGFYCHAGQSYGSTSHSEASSVLSVEVQAANGAAKLAKELIATSSSRHAHNDPFILSIGSTPTAHAFAEPSPEVLALLRSELHGKLELHAGNYPVLDLQQMHTGLVQLENVSHRVLASIISYYPGRAADGGDEAMCDAGAIAMSKDSGPSGGFGEVVGDIGKGWKLARISQEHGILVRKKPSGGEIPSNEDKLQLGSVIQLISQHACLTASNYPWFYVVDSDVDGGADKVVDVWVPWKGW